MIFKFSLTILLFSPIIQCMDPKTFYGPDEKQKKIVKSLLDSINADDRHGAIDHFAPEFKIEERGLSIKKMDRHEFVDKLMKERPHHYNFAGVLSGSVSDMMAGHQSVSSGGEMRFDFKTRKDSIGADVLTQGSYETLARKPFYDFEPVTTPNPFDQPSTSNARKCTFRDFDRGNEHFCDYMAARKRHQRKEREEEEARRLAQNSDCVEPTRQDYENCLRKGSWNG